MAFLSTENYTATIWECWSASTRARGGEWYWASGFGKWFAFMKIKLLFILWRIESMYFTINRNWVACCWMSPECLRSKSGFLSCWSLYTFNRFVYLPVFIRKHFRFYENCLLVNAVTSASIRGISDFISFRLKVLLSPIESAYINSIMLLSN